MEGIRLPTGLLEAFASRPGRRDLSSLLLGLAVLVPLVVLDLVSGPRVAITSGYAIPPLVAAYLAGVWGVSAVGLASLAVAAASPAWNSGFHTNHVIRLIVVFAGCVIGILTAWYGLRSRAAELRLRLLDSVSAIGGASVPVAAALEQTVDALVPEAGDFCMIDVISDGKASRVAARARGDERAQEVELWLRAREPSIPDRILSADPDQVPEPSLRSPMDERAIAEVARTDQEREMLAEIRVRSTIVVPLVARGRALGALTLVTAWSGRRYGSEDLRFAQILAARVALALDNAGLFSDLESVERRLDAVMLSLREAVLVYDDRGSIVYANPAAASWLGYENQRQLVDSDAAEVRERFRVFDEQGAEIEDPVTELAQPGNLSDPLLLRVLTTGARDERWARFTVEPIAADGGGPLYAVMAIEDLTEVKRAEITQRLLAETGEILSEGGGEDALQRVADFVVPEFSDWCAVSMPDDEDGIRLPVVAARDAASLRLAQRLSSSYRASPEGPMAQVMASGQAELIEVSEPLLEGLARDSSHLELLISAGARSAILAPIAAGTKVLGAISFINAKQSRRFDADDLAIAVEIGRRAGQALETERLTREIADVAATLQMELMPSQPIGIPGWKLSTMYRPAGEVSYVGGDFYDAFEVPDGWVIVMGDVVGRGPAAASLTAVARDTLRSVATLSGDPVEALQTLDRVLRVRERPGICSAVLVLLPRVPCDSATIRVTAAGHPLPLKISRAGEVAAIGSFGPLLGAFEDAAWDPTEVRLEKGDQIVLYTDGVTESKRSAGDRFGEKRLIEELAGATDPDAVIERVGQALTRFGAAQGLDDVATMAVALEGAPVAGKEEPGPGFRGLRTGGDAEPSESPSRAVQP